VSVLVYRFVGVVCVGLATAGVFLPLMPTTVFLLIALWAFAKGSPEWADRVRRHPRLGPFVRDWEERRAIPRRAKALAVRNPAGGQRLHRHPAVGLKSWEQVARLAAVDGGGVLDQLQVLLIVERPFDHLFATVADLLGDLGAKHRLQLADPVRIGLGCLCRRSG
jgi:hypothetical protein